MFYLFFTFLLVQEPYVRRKQVPQQSASTVSSSDSAVFLQVRAHLLDIVVSQIVRNDTKP